MRNRVRDIVLKIVSLIVSFKRATEKMFLPWEGRVKPEENIAFEVLFARFPRYLRHPSSSVCCGDGWYPLIWDLCTAIEALEHLGMPKVGALKAEERLGGLFIRVESNSFVVKELALDTEKKAATVCEECGAPASLRLGHGFAKTLCAVHGRKEHRVAPHPTPPTNEESGAVKLLFLDTEFTDFDYPQLISIALIAESGESFYAELADGWSPDGCSPFVRENVLPQLTGGDFTQERQYAGRRLAAWLSRFGSPLRVVSDAPAYDWRLMVELLGEDFPQNLLPGPLPLFSDSFPALWPQILHERTVAFGDKKQHHAVNDAEAIREAWEIMRSQLHPSILEQYVRI